VSTQTKKFAAAMAASLLCFILIRDFEKFEPFPYLDGAGHPTVGYGHKILPGEDFSEGISREEAEELLRRDVDKHQRAVRKYVKVPLTQGQYDALCSFVFNVGTSAFKDSGMLKALNKGLYDESLSRHQMWIKRRNDEGQKVVSNGLVVRRKAEKDMWQGNYNPKTKYK